MGKGNNRNYRTQETHGNPWKLHILSWYSVDGFQKIFPSTTPTICWRFAVAYADWARAGCGTSMLKLARGVARQALLPDDLMWIRDHLESLVEVNSSHSSENIWNVHITYLKMGNPKWSIDVHGLSTPSPFSEHLKTPIILAPIGATWHWDPWGAGMLRSPTVSFGLWRWDELIRWIR